MRKRCRFAHQEHFFLTNVFTDFVFFFLTTVHNNNWFNGKSMNTQESINKVEEKRKVQNKS